MPLLVKQFVDIFLFCMSCLVFCLNFVAFRLAEWVWLSTFADKYVRSFFDIFPSGWIKWCLGKSLKNLDFFFPLPSGLSV